MKMSRDIMGMPVSIEIVGGTKSDIEKVFSYLVEVDERFSTYKEGSEIRKIQRGELSEREFSPQMQEVLRLSRQTELDTNGYFSVQRPDGHVDPTGLVKGWAIQKAAKLIEEMGFENYFLNVGGDIQSKGVDSEGKAWTVGIRNPFDSSQLVKVLSPHGRGVATSGSYIRGAHIYNPLEPSEPLADVVSITIVGPDIYEADRFATAAFAMGRNGIDFVERLPGFEGYSIDAKGIATETSGFASFVSYAAH